MISFKFNSRMKMQDSTQNEFLQDKTTIFMACDGALDFALANMIIGLKRYNEDLIDKIYVFYDAFDDETLSKISSIWPDKIIFQRYSDEDFCRDIKNNEFLKDCEFTKLYSKFSYSKWYIFDILAKAKTQSAIFLDVDMLCVGSLKELLHMLQGVDYLARLGSGVHHAQHYFKDFNINPKGDFHTFNGGLIAFSKNIFQKTKQNLTQKCFEILLCFYGQKQICDFYDEAVLSIIGALYNFSFKDTRGSGYNYIFAWDTPCEMKIIHSVRHSKFWKNSASFYTFNEWYVNYKIWVVKYGGENKIKIPALPIENLKNSGDLYRFFENYNKNSKSLHDKIQQLSVFEKEAKALKNELNALPRKINEQELINLKLDENVKKIQVKEMEQNLNIKKLEVKKLEKELGMKLSKLEPRVNLILSENLRNSAVARMRNHLAYRLGAAIIVCNKSLWGLASLPFVLSFIKAQYKKEQAAYQTLINQKPEFKLLKIETYADYKAALKEKECLTYKLGEAMIRADKAWYKFGYVKFYVEAKRLEKEFKNK